MLIPIVLFILGLLLLIRGGDWFVNGASGLARRMAIPEILIGATVVSIGTTLPEVFVSSTASLQGHGEIAYGNAIGSIICNTALIAALTVTIRPAKIDGKVLKLPVLFFFIAAFFYAAIAYTLGFFSRTIGCILLGLFALYMFFTTLQTKASMQSRPVISEKYPSDSLLKAIGKLVIGAACIAIGADLLVDNGTQIAEAFGVPESVIALTFVSLGTSLPELVTAVTALAKGHSALSLGNIIGANLFNLVLVSGVSTVLSPFAVPASGHIGGINTSLLIDIPVMLFSMAVLTLPTLRRGKLSRLQGILLLAVYVAFCMFQFAL